MDENKMVKIWKRWADHWRFANQTAFRIPEYLESVLGAWRQVSVLLQNSKVEAESEGLEPLQFVRHALVREADVSRDTPRYAPQNVAAVAGFTQSTNLACLLGAKGNEDIKKWAEALESNIKLFAKTLKGREELWARFLNQIKSSASDKVAYDQLRELPRQRFASEHIPVLIGSLYLIYANASHVGFWVHHLNEKHLSKDADARDQILGYLVTTLRSEGGNALPVIHRVRSLRFDGSLGNEITTDTPQSKILWLLSSAPELLDSFSELIFDIWAVLNLAESAAAYFEAKGSKTPRRTQRKRKITEHHLAMPVYAWSEAPQSRNQLNTLRYRAGALLGWTFHQFRKKPPKWPSDQTKTLNKDLYQHLRSLSFMLEDFAANYLAGEAEWALERLWQTGDTAESYMIRNFHHSGGWQCTKIKPEHGFDNYCKQDVDDPGLKVNLTRKLPETSEDGKSFRRVSSKPLVAHILPNSLCLAPAPPVAGLYQSFVAEKARRFYHRCVLIAEQRRLADESGRATAAEEAHAKTAHQLRKLTRHIHSSTRSEDLDALRRYYSLTFLHPKSFLRDGTIRLMNDINDGGEFGPDFLRGRNLKELIQSAYRYSSTLYPLLLKLHNASTTVGTRPRLALSFSRNAEWNYSLWSHSRAIKLAIRSGAPLGDEDANYLQCKAFYYAALVSLWLNIMEHSPRGSRVSLKVNVHKNALIVKNRAANVLQEQTSTERSLGTSHTLHYYFRSCFPPGCISGEVDFPDKPRGRIFTTSIPLPLQFLCPMW